MAHQSVFDVLVSVCVRIFSVFFQKKVLKRTAHTHTQVDSILLLRVCCQFRDNIRTYSNGTTIIFSVSLCTIFICIHMYMCGICEWCDCERKIGVEGASQNIENHSIHHDSPFRYFHHFVCARNCQPFCVVLCVFFFRVRSFVRFLFSFLSFSIFLPLQFFFVSLSFSLSSNIIFISNKKQHLAK